MTTLYLGGGASASLEEVEALMAYLDNYSLPAPARKKLARKSRG